MLTAKFGLFWQTNVMAAIDYVKQASAMLRRAAEATKLDLDGLQRDLANIDSQKGSEIQQMKQEEIRKEAEIAATDNSDEERLKAREVQEARQAQSNIEAERNQLKAQTTDRINQLQQVYQDLMQNSKDLDRYVQQM